jgi:hypothetical protein
VLSVAQEDPPRAAGIAPLIEYLERIQLGIDAGRLREEILVTADLGHPAALERHDGVGPADGRQAVRDDERGAVPHQVGQRVLHQQLRLGVERRGRFVQDQDRRVLQQRARDGQALALPARQPLAALADARLVPVRAALDELVRVRRARRLLDRRASRPGTP